MTFIYHHKRIMGVLAFLALSLPVFSQSPKLFQVTTAETQPGDAVLLRGEYLDKIQAIQACRLPDENVDNALPAYVPLPHEDALPDRYGTGKKVSAFMDKKVTSLNPLQQNRQSVKFIIPARWQNGIYSIRIIGADKQVTDFYVNTPKVNWAISEEGLKALAGDYLRIQGKNLLRKGLTGQAVLISADQKNNIRVKVDTAFDDFSVRVSIPANAPAGNYHLSYHNGLGGKTAWSEPLAITVVTRSADPFAKKTFNVKDFGAKGDGQNNETAAFRAALNAAEENGGGTVYVPRGRYQLTGEIILPPYTLLKGESKQLTQLFWNPLNWETGELPNSLVSGTHHFGLKDLNLWSSRAWGIIFTTGPKEEQGHVTLENLIVRQTAELGGMVYQDKKNRDVVEAELHSRWTQTGIVIRGENLKVRNCDFNTAGMYTFHAVSGFIQHSRFTKVGTGVNQPYMAIHPKGLIFEDCHRQGDGYGYAATIDESYNLYEARNITPFDYVNDRECMTLDGGSGAYFGKIAQVKGNAITIPAGSKTNNWTVNKWTGGGLFIIDGKGAGQYRRIVKHTLDVIELDQPFLVDPDASSEISITTIRRNLFFINNEVIDAGAYQFYGSAQICVISGLKMTRANGVVSRGSLLYRGKQPNWYIDIVNCEFRECNYSHWFGIDDRGHSGNTNINLIGAGGTGLNIGTLVRRNKLYDFAYIRTSPGANSNAVTDVIIEDNSFTMAKKAISLGGANDQTSNVLIHNNHYSEVEQKIYIPNGLKATSYLVIEDEASTAMQPRK